MPRRLNHLLEAESGANDPMAVVLTVGLLASWEGHVTTVDWVVFGVRQLGGGLVVGVAIGCVGAELLEAGAPHQHVPVPRARARLRRAGLRRRRRARTCPASSPCTSPGLVVAARAPSRRRAVLAFHEGLASTAQIGLFLLLGLLVFPSRLDDQLLGALGIALVLVLVARPLAVLASIGWMRFRLAELVLVSWAGLRGRGPIVLATFPLTAGYPEGELIFDVVFFVVVISVLLQGLTAAALARRLGLEAEPDTAASVAEALPIDAPGVEVLEIEVGSSCAVVGRSLLEVPPPLEARVAAVLRGWR